MWRMNKVVFKIKKVGKMKANLGDKVKDEIRNFTGTVTAIAVYLTGKEHYLVTPPSKEGENTASDGYWVEHDQIKVEEENEYVPFPARKIQLGDKVVDVVSDFKGVVTARAEYLNGCSRILIRGSLSKWQKIAGKRPQEIWVDDNLCVIQEKDFFSKEIKTKHKKEIRIEQSIEKRKTGGPMPSVPKP